MENLQKVDSFQFEVDMTTVDKLHRMRPSALCNMMLACAGRHADTRGFGATRKLGWVMARMVLDIKNIPLGGQKFTIETFIKNAYRGFTDRCIRAVDENGNELAAMMCTFAMIDLDTRAPFDFDSAPLQRMLHHSACYPGSNWCGHCSMRREDIPSKVQNRCLQSVARHHWHK